ncbi:hypothetical protein [Nocardia sp. NPDC058497]|uniref:hypothetical protein n=1 Tax=Nocardia sp. NPDC058497 TaxID=3346529 RepID=UPI0036694B42
MHSRIAPLKQDVPSWAVVAAWICVAAALPTVVWRGLLGFGFELGTPAAWRAEQMIPGEGTAYVLGLSIAELLAALLALRLVHPRGDVVPRWSPISPGRRAPIALVSTIALTGAVILIALCAMSIDNWSGVDPFGGEPESAWSKISDACYLAVLAWPPALIVTVAGYISSRRIT